MEKIISYIGFAIKSNKVVVGQTSLKNCKQKICLIIVENNNENLINLAKNLAKKHNCELLVSKLPLSKLTNKIDIKIIGLTDENLSNAIIKNKEKIDIG